MSDPNRVHPEPPGAAAPAVEAASRNVQPPVYILTAGPYSGLERLIRLLRPACCVWSDLFGPGRGLTPLAAIAELNTDPSAAIAEGESPPTAAERRKACRRFLRALLAVSARRQGARCWGVAHAATGNQDAAFFRSLYPRGRVLLLSRNPYDAYAEYVTTRNQVQNQNQAAEAPHLARRAAEFGRQWRRRAESLLDQHAPSAGFWVRCEDLRRPAIAALEAYLGFALSPPEEPEGDEARAAAGVSPEELAALEQEVAGIAARLGYAAPRNPAVAAGVHSGAASSETDPARCVVLTPVGAWIEPDCDEALRVLEARGYPVRRVRGYSQIDHARNVLATTALDEGFEETMWIDADIAFRPEAVDRLRSHGLPLTSAVYPQKGKRILASRLLPGTKKLRFGRRGGLVEIQYAATGFLHVRREVYRNLERQLQLPRCNQRFGEATIPFFQPLIVPNAEGHWYLAEDYAFCERARRCGYQIWADTTIRLRHIGKYAYSWEDAGCDLERYPDYTFHVTPST